MVNFLQMTKSRLRQKILSYFFTNPDANPYLRELAAILREDPGNISKEFAKLTNEGVFTYNTRGRQKYFSINKKYPLYKELKAIVFKTVGVEGCLREIVNGIDGIWLSLIYGSFAENRERSASDIDLLIVGSPDEDILMDNIENAEKRLHRDINYNIYPVREFKERIKKKDSFISNILKRPKIILKGSIDRI